MNSPFFSSSGFGLDSSEQWWPRISGKMTPVHFSTVRWSPTIWPYLTSFLVVRESNTSPWISLFLLFSPISFSAVSLIHPPPRWIVFPLSVLGPDITPLPSVSAPSCTHFKTQTLQHIGTHIHTQKQMCATTFMFHWVISHTLIYGHACTPHFLCDYLACPALAPVNSELVTIDLFLFLPPTSPPFFLLCCILPSLYIYVTSCCFLWKQQTWQVRISCTLCIYRGSESSLPQQNRCL